MLFNSAYVSVITQTLSWIGHGRLRNIGIKAGLTYFIRPGYYNWKY